MSGTGLDIFNSHHPTRFFDVGIAEQHAVTMAAGLATEGFKPFVAKINLIIYFSSTNILIKVTQILILIPILKQGLNYHHRHYL